MNEHRVVDEVQRVSLRQEPDGVYVKFAMPNQTWLIGRFPSLAVAQQILGEAIEPVEDLWKEPMPRDTPEVEAWLERGKA